MSESPGNGAAPYAPPSQDVAVLIGIMALLEGESFAGSLDDHLMRRIGDRFNRVGLLADSFDTDDVRQALNAMNYRLRRAAGEDESPE